jgi:hypothetical protein
LIPVRSDDRNDHLAVPFVAVARDGLRSINVLPSACLVVPRVVQGAQIVTVNVESRFHA